ncbi:MAG: AAC(3) family N-acetyltransferase [Gemmatimonadota bacterium]|nr:AAC(3) family N-acetyltransferase [Gemmatimonadota bacterium]
MYTRSELASGFRSLGVSSGDTVMVHASVRSVGPIAGGADEIHLALKEALGNDGTILMYAGAPANVDDVGRGHFSAEEEAEVLEKLPPFDGQVARSDRSHGALVEFLRTYPGTLAGNHVTRFIAWGKQSAHLLSHEPWDFTYGAGSVLERFVELNGKVLLIGPDHDTVTLLHYVEHIAEIADKRVVQFRVPVLEQGVRVWREMLEYDSSRGAHANWPDRFFALIVDGYLAATSNLGGKAGNATCYLIEAPGLCEFALKVMVRVAENPTAVSDMRELPLA